MASSKVQFHKHSEAGFVQKREVIINIVQNCGPLWLNLGLEFRTSMTG